LNDEQPVSLQPSTVKLDDLVSAFEKLKSINSSYMESPEDRAHKRRIDWLVARSAVASAGLVLFVSAYVLVNPWNNYSEDMQRVEGSAPLNHNWINWVFH
jgi:hypothetical protein